MKASAPLKVGILAIVSIFILIFGIMWLKGRSISIGEKIEVPFKDIDGMRPGSAVRMMGMRIGQVDEIEPVIDGENSHIVVKFVISEPDVKIPPASKISVQQSGIIGEKFLEITPPFPKTVIIPLKGYFQGEVKEGSAIELLAGGTYIEIGKVKSSRIVNSNTLTEEERRKIKTPTSYRIEYFINIPDVEIPANSKPELVKTSKTGEYRLRFNPPDNVIVKMPEYESKFTIVEPLRMNDFLDVQLEAALALKETNDKINNLFTDEFMTDIKYTVENTRDLSEKAGLIVDQVAVIVDSSKEDIRNLIASATQLSENMNILTQNANEIVDDPVFKDCLLSLAGSIKTTSDEFSALLKDSKLQDSLVNINSTTKDVSEIADYVNALTKDQEFGRTVEESVTNLNDMMIKLSRIADSVDELTVEEKANIKEIINNSSEASKDLKKFSKKLNQRFLLLRLLF
ncbi:MAG TPA: MlaD family protein [Candidatus Gastranaerophilales bacterium]|nr:MlaD family protein [Candidatus Gastranaerophilales bacterium]